MKRLTKIAVDWRTLPTDASDWVAVRDETTKLVWTAGEMKAMKWKAAVKWVEKLDLLGGGWRLPHGRGAFLSR